MDRIEELEALPRRFPPKSCSILPDKPDSSCFNGNFVTAMAQPYVQQIIRTGVGSLFVERIQQNPPTSCPLLPTRLAPKRTESPADELEDSIQDPSNTIGSPGGTASSSTLTTRPATRPRTF